MSLAAAITANVILDIAIVAYLAYAMSRPMRFTPHAHRNRFEGIEASVAAARHLADVALQGESAPAATVSADVAGDSLNRPGV